MALIGMKSAAQITVSFVIFFLLFLLFSLVILPGTFAGKTPFLQCIRVLDADGNLKTGLTCSYEDIFQTTIMAESNGVYCVTINSSYDFIEYSFISTCTDGSINKSVYGSFVVDERFISGQTPNLPPIDYDVPEHPLSSVFSGLYLYFDEHPLLSSLALFGTVGLCFFCVSEIKKLKKRGKK